LRVVTVTVMKIRVLIVGDRVGDRADLPRLIAAQPDLDLAAAPATPSDAAARQAAALRPDVAVLDASLPDTALLEVIESVRRAHPATRFLVVAGRDRPGRLDAALAMGASGYIVKHAPAPEIVAAIHAVHHGRTFIDAGHPPSRYPPAVGPGGAGGQPLSHREREVLVLIARGHPNRDIAKRLRVSVKTVETYRARLARKLGARTRAALVEYALLHGLLSAEARDLPDIA
jgi:two-component system response regulator NreC